MSSDPARPLPEPSSNLLHQVRAETPLGWQRLVDLYAPVVRRWCQRAGLQPADADEVLQEVLLGVRRAVGNFSRDRGSGSFPAWLWLIARRRILDQFRRRGRQPDAVGGTDFLQRLEQEPNPANDSSGSLPLADVLSPLLRRALDLVRNEFEETTWRAFWLTVVDEKPAADVAAQLGLSAGAVRIAKSRVLKRLRLEVGLPSTPLPPGGVAQ